MALYLVSIDNAAVCGLTKIGGHDTCLVSAASEVEAKQMAHAQSDSDGRAWLDSSTAVALGPDADWAGWIFRVEIDTPTPIVATYTAAAGNLAANIGAGLVAALNADAAIAGASYSAPTLTAAAIADNLGNRTLRASARPPGKAEAIPALIGAIVHQGIAGAALTVVLNLDNAAIPTFHRPLTQ